MASTRQLVHLHFNYPPKYHVNEEDLQIMGVRRWRKQCAERAELKKSTEKVKTHSGL